VTEQDTKQRLLDAAERLFAEVGYEQASMRALTTAAGVNLAAANYHFGSKAGLLQAVLRRRVGPVNAARMAALDALDACGGTPTVEDVLSAFLRPVVHCAEVFEGGPDSTFRRCIGRLTSMPGEHSALIGQVFQEVVERTLRALGEALPHLPEEDLHWRFQFTLGGLLTVISDPERMHMISGGRCDPNDADAFLDQLLAFSVGAFRAPATARGERGEAG
jgi:AcrR family transcriptional regulator